VTKPRAALSQSTLDGFLAGDSRAYARLTEFLLERARRLGAALDGEDLAQKLLLDLLRLRDRGALKLRTASELEAYLQVSLRRRYISSLRARHRTGLDGDIESVPTGAADGPDGFLRGLEHVELCVNLMRHALERSGAAPATWAVMERVIDRFVFGKDVETALIDSGLLQAAASAEERWQERNNENRRQSRARATLIDALHRLGEASKSSTAKGSLNTGSRQIPFDADDVHSALRFALALGRSEGAKPSNSRARP
jgi:DNA-directed RNA polymerase specialized sigma24 family protein